MSGTNWTIGIDFGTSNTAAAHTNPVKGTVEAVNLSHNRTTMSSSVYVESPEQIDVGDVAMDKAESNPAGFIPAPKRVIPQQMFQVNGYDLSASMPVAAVLSSVVQRVSREHGNVQPSELVLTHPEAWSSNEIKVLLDAAAQLGLSAAKISTISEPQAAAHYYSRAKALQPGQRIAVFDFGGGTLDVAVLEANDNDAFDVIAARGDNTLGGKTFDAMMRRWVDQQLDDRNPELLDYFRTQAPLQERHALEDSIRRAKELLSEASYATVVVSGGGETERFQITRAEFEEIISPALDKAVALTRATLADAGITNAEDLVALYLTGGSSRIPLVQDRLKNFGPLATLDDPKTVVAQGAISALGPIVRGMTPHNMGADAPTMQEPAQGGVDFGSSGYGTPNYGTTNYGASAPTATAPAGQVASATPAASTSAPSKTRRNLIIAAAAVVAVAVVGATTMYLLGNGKSEETTTTQPTAAATSSASAGNLVSREAVIAAAPSKFRESLDKCELNGTTETGRLKVQCQIKEGSSAYSYFARDSTSVPIVTFNIDPDSSDIERRRITEGWYDTRNKDTETVENGNKTAAAFIYSDTATSGSNNKYSLAYSSTETNLILTSSDLKDKESAKAYLQAAGLM